MKTLSLWQPWASLLVGGYKTIETRSWSTSYRGPLLIHSTKRLPEVAKEAFSLEPFNDCLARMGYWHLSDLPRGVIVGRVELQEIVAVESIRDKLPGIELAFADYSDGRFAWITGGWTRFDEPIPAKGHQGLWDWEGRLPCLA